MNPVRSLVPPSAGSQDLGGATSYGMNNKTIGALCYLVFFAPGIFGKNNDSFLSYHSRQGLILLVSALAMQGAISIIGYWGGPQYLLAWVVRAVLVYFAIIGASSAMKGETKPLPYLSDFFK